MIQHKLVVASGCMAVRQQTLRAPVSITVQQTAAEWLDGAGKGLIRNRKGDPYKPATIRAYEIALRLCVLPEIGSMRLSEVTRTDLQDLVDGLLASGLNESTIGVTLLPLHAIYKRALSQPETGIVVNPTSDLKMPAVRGGRDRIASPDECAELSARQSCASRVRLPPESGGFHRSRFRIGKPKRLYRAISG